MRRRVPKLDDLLVRAEEAPDGSSTGRYVLLDGLHRRAAYRSAWRSPSERRGGVPVSVFTGPRMEAPLLTLASNVRRKLGPGKAERMDAAWRMVWEHGLGLSKSRLAEAADVSVRTVGTMRTRWQEMLEANKLPTFDWWADKGEPWVAEPELAEGRRNALTAATAELRRHLLRRPRPSTEFLTEVATNALGEHSRHVIADDVRGDDEDDPDAEEDPAEPRDGDPDADFQQTSTRRAWM